MNESHNRLEKSLDEISKIRHLELISSPVKIFKAIKPYLRQKIFAIRGLIHNRDWKDFKLNFFKWDICGRITKYYRNNT